MPHYAVPLTALRMVLGLFLLVVFQVNLAFSQSAPPLRGVALIIDQSKYEHLRVLDNTPNDAEKIAQLFRQLGFNVSTASDRNAAKLSRSLDSFISDAEGADVAMVYYSGHGIEAGGDNWLVPIDADIASLELAEEKLVSVSVLTRRLAASVPLTLLFLDACRTNPFPQNVFVKVKGRSVPMTASGLGNTKGAVDAAADGTTTGLGTVISFAAEPGSVAFDGPKNGNSPYAAALFRHLGASTDVEFGTVMRMITEEVYLKTHGQQRPWVNESLMKLLFFGGTGEEIADSTDDDRRLDRGRRDLLLSIASLPHELRKSIEDVANENHIPLDPLFGMLKQLHVDVSADPQEIDKQLRAGIDTLKSLRDLGDTVLVTDPEIVRFTKLADRAQAEGVVELALEYRASASARAAEVSSSLMKIEENLVERHLEVAATYAREAQTAILHLDYKRAADAYRRASVEIEKWDPAMYFDYRAGEASALTNFGQAQGDNAALARSVELHKLLVLSTSRNERPENWALASSNLGIALQVLGSRLGRMQLIDEAVDAYRSALEVRERTTLPIEWARTQNNLGTALWELGTINANNRSLEAAVAAFQSALEVRTKSNLPVSWSISKANLGGVLWALGNQNGDKAQLEAALAAYNSTLTVCSPESSPHLWAKIQNNIGLVYQSLGESTGRLDQFGAAITAYHLSLQIRTRVLSPMEWAEVQNNLGVALNALGERKRDKVALVGAISAFRASLEERTQERAPLEFAMSTSNLGSALLSLGIQEERKDLLREADEEIRKAWKVYHALDPAYDDYFASQLTAVAEAMERLR